MPEHDCVREMKEQLLIEQNEQKYLKYEMGLEVRGSEIKCSSDHLMMAYQGHAYSNGYIFCDDCREE